MAAATLTSRVLGMVREMVYGWFMGTGMVADAFVMAFTIPNLFRRLLGEGALTAAFIPVFKEKERTAGEVEMWRAANATISGLIIAASVIVALVMLGVAGGWPRNGEVEANVNGRVVAEVHALDRVGKAVARRVGARRVARGPQRAHGPRNGRDV